MRLGAGVIITDMKNKIICLAIGVILSLVIAELLLRIAGLGYSLVNKIPQKHENSDYRILCVGESTTFGIGTVNPLLYSYPRQLEQKLNAKFTDLRIQCFYDSNIGVNTTKNLLELPSAIRNYQPNLVIFMVGTNNWWNLDKSSSLFFNKNNLFHKIFIKLQALLYRFRIYKLFKWLVYSRGLYKLEENIEWPDLNGTDAENSEIRHKISEDLWFSIEEKCGMNIFNEIAYYDLQEMIMICKKNKIDIIICSYPVGQSDLYRVQKKLSLLFNCYFVDNTLIFRNLNNPKDYLSNDAIHPNEKGYRIVAENIYNCILDHKLIK